MNAEVLESYLIPEIATEGVGSVLGGICIGILGVTTLVSSHNRRVKNKKTRQDIEAYLQEKGVDGSNDRSIKLYQDKIIASMAQIASQGISKIVSNKKFLTTSENILRDNLRKIQFDMAQYYDGVPTKTWCKYSKGMLKFKPSITGMHNDAVLLVDLHCRLIEELFEQEDNDDNAPEYFDQATCTICDSIGTAVIRELESKFADDIGIGLVSVQYCDMMNSPWGAPCVQLHANSIPNRRGSY